MSTEYGFICDKCGESQTDGWNQPEVMQDIYKNKEHLIELSKVCWSLTSLIYGEQTTIDFILQHQNCDIYIQNEYGERFISQDIKEK